MQVFVGPVLADVFRGHAPTKRLRWDSTDGRKLSQPLRGRVSTSVSHLFAVWLDIPLPWSGSTIGSLRRRRSRRDQDLPGAAGERGEATGTHASQFHEHPGEGRGRLGLPPGVGRGVRGGSVP
jgi:hypothetical protein